MVSMREGSELMPSRKFTGFTVKYLQQATGDFVYYHCIDRRIHLSLSKSTQSAAGLKPLKPAANGRYLMCKSLPYYFHFTVQKYIYSPVSKVHAGSVRVSVIHRDSDMNYGIFNVRT